jgi:hypothetical protein
MSLIAFGALLTLLRGAIGNVNQDPSLANLTSDTTLKVVQIVNINKNLDLPLDNIKPGTYILSEGEEAFQLDGPQTNLFNKDIFALKEDYVRQVLGGFMLENQKYFQKIIVSYPDSPDIMNVEIETQNSQNQSYYQSIKISK